MPISQHSMALKANGQAWAWGYNAYGQLGDDTTVSKSSPVSVVGAHNFRIIATGRYHSLGLKSSGEAWAWGRADNGQVGDNTISHKSSPVSVVGDHEFVGISANYQHSLGLKENGEAWGWGNNVYGRLGDNTTVTKSSPVSVVGDHIFSRVSAGYFHSLALKPNGQAWAWGGAITYGQLGDNTTTSKSSPVSVVGEHQFTAISAGRYHNLALKSNGEVWAWGDGTFGQLGDDTTLSKSSPVSVVGDHAFIRVSAGYQHSLALKENGEAWAWGSALIYGQLGDNTTISKSSPVSVVGQHSFVEIAVGRHHCLALKSNGEVWAWGDAINGVLGDNSITSKSSPVLVVGEHSFSQLMNPPGGDDLSFQYEAGTADDVADWFSKLETFLISVGWTVISGGGTTTIVFNSVGEAGGYTKLYIRFRQSSGDEVYYCVQDDAAGTHRTNEGSYYTEELLAPGEGDVPFYYWMCATKDMVSVAFKAGDGYTGCYVGLLDLFPATVPYEECQMISCGIHRWHDEYLGYVLRRYTGVWNQPQETKYARDFWYGLNRLSCLLDDSFPLLGIYAQYPNANKEALGQLYNVTAPIAGEEAAPAKPEGLGTGLNPEDVITTGFAGATSTWIILGVGGRRWAMRTGGTLPTGSIEGAHFAHQTALANTIEAMVVNIKAFLTAVGWTEYANPSPEWPIDFYMYSPGEGAADDIWVRMYYETNKYFRMCVMDDGAGTHETCTSIGTSANYLRPEDFPTYYWITADRDCMMLMIENGGDLMWRWVGMFNMANPDPDSLDTVYKVSTLGNILRSHDGNWVRSTQVAAGGYTNSSPSLYDGTNFLWPSTYWLASASGGCLIGSPKYIYRLSGSHLTALDTVAVGARMYRYIGENWAFRIA